MQNPVGNIQICFYAFPDKNKKVYDKPVIPVRLKEFVYIGHEESGKDSRADNGSHRSHYYIW
jgi:hypothetical protein